jgi:N-carbamoyl-L-amino-acid hydrolase
VTFGEVSTDPHLHAFAKIPGEVRFCLDVRSAEPKRLIQIERAMEELIGRIEKERGVRFELGERTASTPALLSSSLVQDIATRADALGLSYRRMASGAGHDTAVFANKGVPSTMIFVRNQNGSHNPDEGMRTEDLCVAAKLLACLVAEQ